MVQIWNTKSGVSDVTCFYVMQAQTGTDTDQSQKMYILDLGDLHTCKPIKCFSLKI